MTCARTRIGTTRMMPSTSTWKTCSGTGRYIEEASVTPLPSFQRQMVCQAASRVASLKPRDEAEAALAKRKLEARPGPPRGRAAPALSGPVWRKQQHGQAAKGRVRAGTGRRDWSAGRWPGMARNRSRRTGCRFAYRGPLSQAAEGLKRSWWRCLDLRNAGRAHPLPWRRRLASRQLQLGRERERLFLVCEGTHQQCGRRQRPRMASGIIVDAGWSHFLVLHPAGSAKRARWGDCFKTSGKPHETPMRPVDGVSCNMIKENCKPVHKGNGRQRWPASRPFV